MGTDAASVAIWRNELLPVSETFIAEQARCLSTYRPLFVGRTAANRELFGLDPLVAISDQGGLRGTAEAAWYSLTRHSPYLARRLDELRPALIHAHFGNQAVYALPYQRRLGIPLVTTYHGHDASRVVHRPWRERRLAWRQYNRHVAELRRRGDLFIAVSEPIRRLLLAQGFPPDRVVVHHIGVDVDRFAFRPPGLRAAEKRIVTVCRLVEKKGTSYLIRAMAHPLLRESGAQLRIIGDGPLRASLEREALALGLADRVIFLGTRSSHEVRTELTRATAFALPSVTASDGSTEGLPISILEAMASGIPVVSSWHAGIPEAVLHEETGLLVRERDVDGLAAALAQIVDSEELAVRLAERGRAWIEQEFSLRAQSRRLEQLYDDVCRAPRAAS